MIRPNTAHSIVFDAVNFDNDPLTGVTDLLLTIVNTDTESASFGFVWDWSTDAFTATPVQATAALEEVNATYVPGKYALTWPGAASGTYAYTITQSPGVTVANVPATEVLQVREDAAPGDQMALTSGERTTVQALVLSDATPFQGARIDAAVSSRSAQATVDALPTAAGIADAVLDEALAGHVTAGTLGAALALLDVAVSSRATAAGVWATVTGNADWTYGESVELLRKARTNRLEVTAAGTGTETLYDDGEDGAAILTQTLRDVSGGAITVPTGSPALRGEAA